MHGTTEGQTREVQPAMLVVDPTGSLTAWWSWKRFAEMQQLEIDERSRAAMRSIFEGADFIDPGLVVVDKSAVGAASAVGYEAKGTTFLTHLRPSTDGLLPALLEGREAAIKLQEFKDPSMEMDY